MIGMISPFIQNLGKAKGFSQDEQLVLQIALGGILGNKGGSMGSMGSMGSKGQSNPFVSMAMTLAALLVTHQALTKMGVSQSLQQGSGPNQVSPQTLGLAANMTALQSVQSAQSYQSPQKIAPTYPLQAAMGSLTNPSLNSLSQSQQTQQSLSALPTITQAQKQKSQPTPLYAHPSNP
jgi:hypothetical protein